MLRFPLPCVRTERTLLALAAIGCFALAAVFVPRAGDSQLTPQRTLRTAELTLRAHPDLVPLQPERDAFAPPNEVQGDAPSTEQPSIATANGPHLRASNSRVTAIVTGARSGAIVESPEGERTVAIGDFVDGASVTAITATGIVLADGRILALSAAGAR